MGFLVVGLDFQRLPVMGDGLVDLSAAGQKTPRLLWATARSGLISRAFWYWAMASSACPRPASTTARLKWAATKSGSISRAFR